MPNLINTDSAGNVFYNYITPVVKGESGKDGLSNPDILTYYQSAIGSSNLTTSNPYIYMRLPATGIETKTGTVTTNASTWRFRTSFASNISMGCFGGISSGSSSSNSSSVSVDGGGSGISTIVSDICFKVTNSYATVGVLFSSSFTLKSFYYLGWLREPSYTGSTVYPRGAVAIQSYQGIAKRIEAENTTTLTNLSQSTDSITSPPIVCTAGTDPGDGSETFTDIVIRDAASPNNPVGKLWNCIDMPATCNVGELWRNTGAYDADGSASEQDVYLCVMPWGTRKLGMRVWTENVN